MTLAVNQPQAEFLALDNKFRAFVAGFGTGKTVVGCISQCVHFMKHPRVLQGYFAPTYPQIRDIFYPSIEEVAYELGFKAKVKEGNKEVEFYHGSNYYGTTLCRSMSEPGSIVGFKIGRAMVDEPDLMPMQKAKQAWRKIIARLRWKKAGVKNGVDLTTTPEGFNFAHHQFVECVAKKPELSKNYGLVQATTFDNATNLPDGYIESLIETYPLELAAAYILGMFTNLRSGRIYYAFNRTLHNSLETIQENEPLKIGMDFNVGKMAARVFVDRLNSLHCVDELNNVFDTPAIINLLKDRYPSHHITIYPDASGNSRSTNNASTSDIAELQLAGYRVDVNPSNPLVKDRIQSVNKQFQSNNLFVNVQKCPQTTKDLEQQSYKENGEPDKSTGHDHGNDAFGYPIAYLKPIEKPNYKIAVNY